MGNYFYTDIFSFQRNFLKIGLIEKPLHTIDRISLSRIYPQTQCFRYTSLDSAIKSSRLLRTTRSNYPYEKGERANANVAATMKVHRARTAGYIWRSCAQHALAMQSIVLPFRPCEPDVKLLENFSARRINAIYRLQMRRVTLLSHSRKNLCRKMCRFKKLHVYFIATPPTSFNFAP